MVIPKLLGSTIKFSSPLESSANYEAFVQLDQLFRVLLLSSSIKEIIVIETKAAIFVDCNLMEIPNGENISIEFDDIIEIGSFKIKNISIFFETNNFENLYNKTN